MFGVSETCDGRMGSSRRKVQEWVDVRKQTFQSFEHS